MYIITQYAKVLKRRTRILTKKYRLYAAFSVFLLLQLSNFRIVRRLAWTETGISKAAVQMAAASLWCRNVNFAMRTPP